MIKKNAEKIDILVDKILQRIAYQGNNYHHIVIQEWKTMLGVTVSNATRSIYIKENKLFVHLDSPVIKQEIFMLKDKILDYLNRKIPDAKKLQDIILK